MSEEHDVAPCGEPTDSLVRPWHCTKPADHYGERHTAVLEGIGSMTWGYLDFPDETGGSCGATEETP